jgi:hypothetical protein
MRIKKKQGNLQIIILHYFAFLQHTKYTIYLSTVVDASELFFESTSRLQKAKTTDILHFYSTQKYAICFTTVVDVSELTLTNNDCMKEGKNNEQKIEKFFSSNYFLIVRCKKHGVLPI